MQRMSNGVFTITKTATWRTTMLTTLAVTIILISVTGPVNGENSAGHVKTTKNTNSSDNGDYYYDGENNYYYYSEDVLENSMALRVILQLIYTVICLVGLCGNGIIIYVVASNKYMQTATNIFIGNLAVSGVVTCLLTIPLTSVNYLHLRQWPLGEALCKLATPSMMTNMYVGIYTSVAISVERYLLVVKPLALIASRQRRNLFTTRNCFIVISTIWILAALISVPLAVYQNVVAWQQQPLRALTEDTDQVALGGWVIPTSNHSNSTETNKTTSKSVLQARAPDGKAISDTPVYRYVTNRSDGGGTGSEWNSKQQEDLHAIQLYCQETWPQDGGASSKAFTLSTQLLHYVLPCCVITICYARVLSVLRRRAAARQATRARLASVLATAGGGNNPEPSAATAVNDENYRAECGGREAPSQAHPSLSHTSSTPCRSPNVARNKHQQQQQTVAPAVASSNEQKQPLLRRISEREQRRRSSVVPPPLQQVSQRRRRSTCGELNTPLEVRRARRTTKMLIAVVLIFAICWLPLNLLHCVLEFRPQLQDSTYFTLIGVCAHMVAMSNVAYNVFLYGWMNENFHSEFKEILQSCLKCRTQTQQRRDSQRTANSPQHRCCLSLTWCRERRLLFNSETNSGSTRNHQQQQRQNKDLHPKTGNLAADGSQITLSASRTATTTSNSNRDRTQIKPVPVHEINSRTSDRNHENGSTKRSKLGGSHDRNTVVNSPGINGTSTQKLDSNISAVNREADPVKHRSILDQEIDLIAAAEYGEKSDKGVNGMNGLGPMSSEINADEEDEEEWEEGWLKVTTV